MDRKRIAAGAVALAATFMVAAAPAHAAPNPAAPAFVAGADGFGDDYFPFAGNGGYDVSHYDLDVDYDFRTQQLDASVRIAATATRRLRRFNLDLRGFDISRLEVNGHPSAFARDGEHELVVTPHTPLITGLEFTVEIDYTGVPQTVVDPDGSFEGWVKRPDGAFVVSEPQGSPSWFPVNDDPNDKATFDFAITVPEGKTALANGVLLSSLTEDGRTTWRWTMRQPISPYLVTATNGDFNLTIGSLSDGTPSYVAIAPGRNGTNLAQLPEIHALFEELFGPYPWEATGGIVDSGGVGYALETATKANYDSVNPGLSTVVHEISHEWFGNAVTLENWRDIWLNEGFARWCEWIWTERAGGNPASVSFRNSYNARGPASAFWQRPPADLGGPANLFASQAYDRGGMTLQALRETIGEDDFFALLRTWYAENKYGNVSADDFIETAERVSGEQLDDFFQAWLYTPARPPLPGA